MTDATDHPSQRKTRFLAMIVLTGFVSGLAYIGRQVYEIVTDSFVAPIILSPDSDLVLASKLSFGQLTSERTRVAGELDEIATAIEANETAITRLKRLKRTLDGALEWTAQLNDQTRSGGEAELAALSRQRGVLGEMIERQRKLTEEARRNYRSGLVSGVDYAREEQALDQMAVALLENQRTQSQSELQLRQARLARRSMAAQGGVPATPEMIVREEQVIHIELEMIKLDAELRAKRSEQVVEREKLAKIDELTAQMRQRPVFRATERPIDVAFVPYTQLDGVHEGGEVRACVWGVFHCETVGSVHELVPGEVVLPDPWGNQARGQYAILDLSDKSAAKNKVLRVRGGRPDPALATPSAVALVK